MRAHTFFAVVLVALSGGAGAQPLGTDVFGAARFGDLLRFAPGGAVTTVGRFGQGDLLNMVTMDTDNRQIIAIDALLAYPLKLIRIDPIRRTRRIVWRDDPFVGSMTWVDVDQDGDYLVSEFTSRYESSRLFKIASDGKSISTVFTGPGSQTYNCFVVDKGSGDYLLGEWYGNAIVRVDRDSGTITTIVPLGIGSLTGMAQDPHTSMVYVTGDTRTGMVMGYDPVTNAVSRIVPPGSINPNGIAVDRSPGTNGAMIYVAVLTSVLRFDRNGNNLGILGTAASTSWLAGITFDRSRNLASLLVAAPNDRVINVDFPGDAGRPYVVAFSQSGYSPGIRLPDGRTIPLNPDGLTLLTANFALPPFVTGNIGVLDTAGQATVRLNLNGVPVSGLRLWATAVTIDPSAPMGISQISAPLLFVL